MQMKYKHLMYAASMLFTLLIVPISADEGTTKTTTVTPQSTVVQSSTVAPATTPAPKVDIKDSALCKKCFCDTSNQQLDCSGRQIKEWFSDEEWKTLQKSDTLFEIINLEHNNLTTIPQLPSYSVKNLYLAFNQIDSIAIGAFQNLANLTKLDLSHNKITSKILVPDVFKGAYSPSDYLPLYAMRELNLGYNELHNLDADVFEHLPKLEVLILCKNTFKVIDHLTETAIAGLTSMKTLDMSYMEIEKLPENFLHGPRELETLILTGNLFKKLPEKLELAVNLKALVLDENLIEDIAGDNVFPAIANLEYLSISYMPEMKRIDAGAISNLQNLTTLIASNNPKLTYIDKAALSKSTPNPMFRDYPPLKKLYLHNNNLTILDRELVYRWDKVTEIDLRFNPWACDETNDYLVNILIEQIKTNTPILAKDVVCNSPPELKSVSLLDVRAKEAAKPGNSMASVVLVIGLVALLVGTPIVIATVVIYRRGCFGMLYRRASPAGAQYSRADSAEDLHI